MTEQRVARTTGAQLFECSKGDSHGQTDTCWVDFLLSVERVDTIAMSRLLPKERLNFRQRRARDPIQVLRYQRASSRSSHDFPYAAHLSESTSACSRTSCVAFSCLSGG